MGISGSGFSERIRTRTNYAELLEEASEEEEAKTLESVIERIEKQAEETLNVLGWMDWMEKYEKALKSSVPIIVLHFNVDDFMPAVVHLAYESLKKPFLVYHHSGPIQEFFYPSPPKSSDGEFASSLQEYVTLNLPRGSARIAVLDYELISDPSKQKPLFNLFYGFVTTAYATGNKLVLLTHVLEEVPTQLASAAAVIELPYPDFEARKKLSSKIMEELAKSGFTYTGNSDHLAFFLGGLSYRNVTEVVSAAVEKVKKEGRKKITVEDVAYEKRERTESIRVYLDPVEPDFKWRWYKNSLIKRILERDVVLPVEHFVEAKEFGAAPSTGFLLMGPPGTGKSAAVRALADRLKYVPIYELSMPKIFSSLLGETNKRFSMSLRSAANSAPCIIFIDEIDTVFQKRESGVVGGQSDVLMQLQGDLFRFMEGEARKKTVILIAATNRPQNLDEALISRFPIRLPVLIPKSPTEREEILTSLLEIKKEKGAIIHDSAWDAVKELARKLEWYSPRDLRNVIDIAANAAHLRYLREGGEKGITGADLLKASEEVKPPSRDVLEEDERISLRYATYK